MIKIEFMKMNGAGNDFVMIDGRSLPDTGLSKDIIHRICDRRRGAGADGLIIIKPSDRADFEMEYYNADGGPGSLCGNGARAAIKFAKMKNYFEGKSTRFVVNGVYYKGEYIDENLMQFFAGNPGKTKLDFRIKAAAQLINSHFADTGSPHAVIEIKDILQNPKDPRSGFTDISEIPVYELGKEIRFSKDFAPGGLNVNFIQIKDEGIFVRTYERGVEDETLACGTGSIASAIVANLKYKLPSPVTIFTRGGDTLKVEFEKKDGIPADIRLSGPAEINYTGTFEINNNLKSEKE